MTPYTSIPKTQSTFSKPQWTKFVRAPLAAPPPGTLPLGLPPAMVSYWTSGRGTLKRGARFWYASPLVALRGSSLQSYQKPSARGCRNGGRLDCRHRLDLPSSQGGYCLRGSSWRDRAASSRERGGRTHGRTVMSRLFCLESVGLRNRRSLVQFRPPLAAAF